MFIFVSCLLQAFTKLTRSAKNGVRNDSAVPRSSGRRENVGSSHQASLSVFRSAVFCPALQLTERLEEANLVPRVFVPLDQRTETRALGATILNNKDTEFCPPGFTAQSVSMAHAPRALVFRPLVKGNEDSGDEIGKRPIRFFHHAILV